MGSQSFVTYSKGRDVKDAYSKAVEDANEQYGHQEGYSGHINSSGGFTDITNEFKQSGKTLKEFIDNKLEKLTKYDGAFAVCTEEPKENGNKIKSQVEHVVTPGTKKWCLKYAVYNNAGSRLCAFDTKGEAVKYARSRTEKTQQTTTVDMEKVLEGVKPRVAKITYKKGAYEKEGGWVFFGWASC